MAINAILGKSISAVKEKRETFHGMLCAEANLVIFISGCQGGSSHTATQQVHSHYMETISDNAIHRAANSNETAAQRVQRQQASIASQLQRIEGKLPHNTAEDSSISRNSKSQQSAIADDLLYGVGSQFSATPGSTS